MRDECKESSMGERSMVSLTLSKKEMGFHWVRFMLTGLARFFFCFINDYNLSIAAVLM